MKQCVTCQINKSLSEYNKKAGSKDGLQNVCRECNRARSRKYHADNREDHNKEIRRRKIESRKRNREYIYKVLVKSGCVDCGYSNPKALEFDHVTSNKIAGVGKMAIDGYSLETIKAEIKKCEVRCRNCHQLKTLGRAGECWLDRLVETV